MFCAAEAAGPCASCHRMVCGDCCTLTEGGTRTWAVCLSCERASADSGRSLTGAWRSFGTWLVGILVVLAALIAVLEWLSS